MIHILFILTLIATPQVDQPAATRSTQVPGHLEVPAEPAIRHFSPGLEEPALYAMLLTLQGLQATPPEQETPAATASQQTEPAYPLDRKALLAKPQEHVGQLLEVHGQFAETQAVHLASGPEPAPRKVWSSLLIDRQSRQPVQILTLDEPIPMGRLANVRCLGYFYKVRQDQAKKPGPDGQRAMVDVPVLIGWIRAEPVGPTKPPRSSFAYHVLPAVLGAVFVGFLIVVMASRQRTDWRTRLEQRRRRRPWRSDMDDQD